MRSLKTGQHAHLISLNEPQIHASGKNNENYNQQTSPKHLFRPITHVRRRPKFPFHSEINIDSTPITPF